MENRVLCACRVSITVLRKLHKHTKILVAVQYIVFFVSFYEQTAVLGEFNRSGAYSSGHAHISIRKNRIKNY